jgi:hypothetical protein
MGFHLAYTLSRVIYPDGFGCIGKPNDAARRWSGACPSNDHSNGDRDYTPHGLSDENGVPEDREPAPGEVADGCKRHWHRDGGYALLHRWI